LFVHLTEWQEKEEKTSALLPVTIVPNCNIMKLHLNVMLQVLCSYFNNLLRFLIFVDDYWLQLYLIGNITTYGKNFFSILFCAIVMEFARQTYLSITFFYSYIVN